MAERRESVRVTASGEDFAREFAKLRRDAEQLNASIRAIPNRVNIRADSDGFTRIAAESRTAERSIDKLSGRLGLLARVAGALGPALIPIGAIGIPAVTGLASSFGFAALAGGTAIGAFQGVGDALEAMNKAHLEPSAENLEKARQAMKQISPAAQEMVKQLRSMGPALKGLRDTAAEGMFPGLSDGLDSIETRLPDVQRIIGAVAGELGDIASDVGASFASARWDDFFTFLETDAPSALADMAEGTGNVTHALAEMWMAFDPVNDDFSSWLVKITGDFDNWASSLSGTTGFQEFMDYLRTTGPLVGEALGAIGNALVQIVQAAAPIGGPVLQGITAFANAIGAIADSDLGTPIFGMVAAISALNLAMGAAGKIRGASFFGGPTAQAIGKQRTALQGLRSDWAAYTAVQRTAQGRAQATSTQMIAHAQASERLRTSLRGTTAAVGRAGAGVAALGILSTEAGQGMGVTNTAALALGGAMLGGPLGAGIGAAVGGFLDLKAAGEPLAHTLDQVNASAGAGNWDQMNAGIDAVRAKIADLRSVTDGGGWLSDWKNTVAGVLSGDLSFGMGGPQLSDSRAAEQQAAIDRRNASQREAGAGAATRQQVAAQAALAHGLNLTAAGARNAAGGIGAFTASLRSANRALTNQSAFDDYKTALLDARQALRDNGQTLNANTRAGLANRAMLRQVATNAAAMGEKMHSADKRMLFMDRARGDFIKLARSMGAGRAEAGRMADRFGLVDQASTSAGKSVQGMGAKIKALKSKIVQAKAQGMDESSAKVQRLRAEIAALHDKSVTLTTEQRTIHTQIFRATHLPGERRADGGTVGGQRYPYADKVHLIAAPGEEVISNRYGQADRNRALLKAINANRYADGGTVAPRVSVAAPNVSVGGTGVRVFIDGNEVRAVVREEVADQRDMDTMRERVRV